jgi:hypothetical protein
MKLGRVREGSLSELKYLVRLADFYCDNTDWTGELKHSEEFINVLCDDEKKVSGMMHLKLFNEKEIIDINEFMKVLKEQIWAIQHIEIAESTLVDNCCDKDSDIYEFKPELVKLMQKEG